MKREQHAFGTAPDGSAKYPTLKLTHVPDTSMAPVYRSGESVNVQLVACYEGDGIYEIIYDGVRLIRLIQKVPGGFRIIAQNPSYYAFSVRPAEITFVARVPINKAAA